MGCEMATIKLPDDDLDDRRTTSELVLSLRKHFHSSHFTKVADILSSREGRMKREIEEKRKENESLLERIINLEVGRLNMICLEDELRQSKNECSELKKQVSELLGHQIKVREVEDRLARVLQRVRCQVDGGMGSSGGENQGGDLKAEGSLDATASVAGGEKVGDDGKLDVIMDVKKENQELENGGDVGIGVGNANLTADHGGCMMDQLEVGSQGTTAPNSAKVIIDIPDSDDESTPCKPAPKEGTTQSLLEPGPSGEHRTHMLKRKWSDTGTNDDNSSREDGKKITRVPDLIPRSDGETTSAQQKLGFPPSSSHDKKTTAAGQSSDRKSLMDLACKLDADDSSSSSSGSGFDINEISHLL